jgi:putative peptide zinc metalloprotease protein
MQAGIAFILWVLARVGRFAGAQPRLAARGALSEPEGWSASSLDVRDRRPAPRYRWLAVLLPALACVPLPTRLSAPGHMKPQQSFTVYAPPSAQVLELPWKDGAQVPQGALLVKLASPDEGVRHAPVAPYAGRVHGIDPQLRPGQWVRRQEALLTLVKPGAWEVEAYLDDDQVQRMQVGDGARFYASGRTDPALTLRVTAIDERAVGGKHRVMLASRQDPRDLAGYEWRGTVVVYGTWEAPALRYLRAAFASS